jgi:hypothetical protein
MLSAAGEILTKPHLSFAVIAPNARTVVSAFPRCHREFFELETFDTCEVWSEDVNEAVQRAVDKASCFSA